MNHPCAGLCKWCRRILVPVMFHIFGTSKFHLHFTGIVATGYIETSGCTYRRRWFRLLLHIETTAHKDGLVTLCYKSNVGSKLPQFSLQRRAGFVLFCDAD